MARADRGLDRAALQTLPRTHGLGEDTGPSHDALPAPGPLKLRGAGAAASAEVNEDAFGVGVRGLQDVVHQVLGAGGRRGAVGRAGARLGGLQSAGAGPRLGARGGSEVPRGALAGPVGAGRHLGDRVPADAGGAGGRALGLVLRHGVQQRRVVALGAHHRVLGQDVPRAGAAQQVLLCRGQTGVRRRRPGRACARGGRSANLATWRARPFLPPDARRPLLGALAEHPALHEAQLQGRLALRTRAGHTTLRPRGLAPAAAGRDAAPHPR